MVLYWVMAAGFENIVEPNYIALYVHIRGLNTVAHARLGSKVDYDIKLVFCKKIVRQHLIGNTAFYKVECWQFEV